MKKPYIICHMMTSVDGRIDCATRSICRACRNIMTRWMP